MSITSEVLDELGEFVESYAIGTNQQAHARVALAALKELMAECERLREALEQIGGMPRGSWRDGFECQRIARAALAGPAQTEETA